MARAGGTTRRMVPAASWSPEDYYRASRHANRAWLATQPQQVIVGVLEAADSGTTSLVESAASSASLDRTPCPGDALDSGGSRFAGYKQTPPSGSPYTETREETC